MKHEHGFRFEFKSARLPDCYKYLVLVYSVDGIPKPLPCIYAHAYGTPVLQYSTWYSSVQEFDTTLVPVCHTSVPVRMHSYVRVDRVTFDLYMISVRDMIYHASTRYV